jgi:hypothetical protein
LKDLIRSCALCLVSALSLPCVSAFGAEDVLGILYAKPGGLICNDTNEVTQVIASLERRISFEDAVQSVEGCGLLLQPMWLRVIAIGSHETITAKYRLVRYEFLGVRIAPQFGYRDVRLKLRRDTYAPEQRDHGAAKRMHAQRYTGARLTSSGRHAGRQTARGLDRRPIRTT